jgi:hypothetical protein
LGSVRIENCSNCYLFLGPCSTSCYMESVTGSIVCCSSHQLRIHNTHDCVLYVCINSHPIIEDCSYLGFAQYELLQYTRPREKGDAPATADNMADTSSVSIKDDVLAAGLIGANCWSNVVDFKWHKDTASPNFYLMSHSKPTHARHVLCDNNADVLPREQPFTSRPVGVGAAAAVSLSMVPPKAGPLVLLPTGWSIAVEHTARGANRVAPQQTAPSAAAAVTATKTSVAAESEASTTAAAGAAAGTADDDEDEI